MCFCLAVHGCYQLVAVNKKSGETYKEKWTLIYLYRFRLQAMCRAFAMAHLFTLLLPMNLLRCVYSPWSFISLSLCFHILCNSYLFSSIFLPNRNLPIISLLFSNWGLCNFQSCICKGGRCRRNTRLPKCPIHTWIHDIWK